MEAPQHREEAVTQLSVPVRRAYSGKYSADLLDTVDWCLRLDHLERPQSVFALQKALLGEKQPEHRTEAPAFFDQLKGVFARLGRQKGREKQGA